MKKIVGILVCVLLFVYAFSVMGLVEDNEIKVVATTTNKVTNNLIYDKDIAKLKSNNEGNINTVYNSEKLDELDQFQTSSCDWGHGVNGDYRLAQSFKPSLQKLTRVVLYVFKRGTPTDLIISIRDSLDGRDLTSVHIFADSIPGEAPSIWYEFDFPDIFVTTGSTYYIVWAQYGGGNDNYVYWVFGGNNPYLKGNAWIKREYWQVYNSEHCEDPDFCFKTYGLRDSENHPPYIPSNPNPPNHALDVDLNADLGWIGGDPDKSDIVTYDIYFGTISTPPKVKSGHGSTSYNPGKMNPGKTYYWHIDAKDNHGEVSYGPLWDFTTVPPTNQPPDKPKKPNGPTSGKAGTSYAYLSSTNDPEVDQIYYLFDWGDGTDSGWKGLYNSGQTASESHIWSVEGTYQIKVKAKDVHGAESDWSDPLSISMPRNKQVTHSLFLQFLQNLMQRFPLLAQLLQLPVFTRLLNQR